MARKLLLALAFLLAISAEARSEGTYLGGGGGGTGADAYGMRGAYMTPATMPYLRAAKTFEFLDPTIPWTRFWIDPYAGSDSNPGTYERPFRTLSEWKERAGFGTWFTIKNGNRASKMIISQQTFPYPADENCEIGETVTYTGGTSMVLDIDKANGKIVFRTLTGNRIVAGDAITSGSRTGAACAWTVGTRAPTLWDPAVYLCILDNKDTCESGNRYTTTNCTGGGANTCVAGIEASIALKDVPARYNQRIVTMIDAENPVDPPYIDSDGRSLGELTDAGMATNHDRNGLFIAGNSASYGCLGVANIYGGNVLDDFMSQHQEGCVRYLNVWTDGVRNGPNANNNNVITTHGGELGRGGVVAVNSGGTGFQWRPDSGAPIAPTQGADSSAYMILIGGEYGIDGSAQGSAGGLAPMSGSGGRIVAVGTEIFCKNMTGTNGCQGWSLVSTQGDSTFDLIRSTARIVLGPGDASAESAAAGISLSTSGNNSIAARIYRPTFQGPVPFRGIFTNAASGPIWLDVRGAILDALRFYLYDFSSSPAQLSGSVSGVYDNDGSNRWHIGNPGSDYSTAAAADAAAANVAILSDGHSVQTDVVELSGDYSARCVSTGECWDAYNEAWSVDFPVVIYDYLPVGIRGYAESGTRNYGGH